MQGYGKAGITPLGMFFLFLDAMTGTGTLDDFSDIGDLLTWIDDGESGQQRTGKRVSALSG